MTTSYTRQKLSTLGNLNRGPKKNVFGSLETKEGTKDHIILQITIGITNKNKTSTPSSSSTSNSLSWFQNIHHLLPEL